MSEVALLAPTYELCKIAPFKNVHKKGVFRFCVRFAFRGYTSLELGLSVCTKLFEIFFFVRFYLLGFDRFLGRYVLGNGCRFLLRM